MRWEGKRIGEGKEMEWKREGLEKGIGRGGKQGVGAKEKE